MTYGPRGDEWGGVKTVGFYSGLLGPTTDTIRGEETHSPSLEAIPGLSAGP